MNNPNSTIPSNNTDMNERPTGSQTNSHPSSSLDNVSQSLSSALPALSNSPPLDYSSTQSVDHQQQVNANSNMSFSSNNPITSAHQQHQKQILDSDQRVLRQSYPRRGSSSSIHTTSPSKGNSVIIPAQYQNEDLNSKQQYQQQQQYHNQQQLSYFQRPLPPRPVSGPPVVTGSPSAVYPSQIPPASHGGFRPIFRPPPPPQYQPPQHQQHMGHLIQNQNMNAPQKMPLSLSSMPQQQRQQDLPMYPSGHGRPSYHSQSNIRPMYGEPQQHHMMLPRGMAPLRNSSSNAHPTYPSHMMPMRPSGMKLNVTNADENVSEDDGDEKSNKNNPNSSGNIFNGEPVEHPSSSDPIQTAPNSSLRSNILTENNPNSLDPKPIVIPSQEDKNQSPYPPPQPNVRPNIYSSYQGSLPNNVPMALSDPRFQNIQGMQIPRTGTPIPFTAPMANSNIQRVNIGPSPYHQYSNNHSLYGQRPPVPPASLHQNIHPHQLMMSHMPQQFHSSSNNPGVQVKISPRQSMSTIPLTKPRSMSLTNIHAQLQPRDSQNDLSTSKHTSADMTVQDTAVSSSRRSSEASDLAVSNRQSQASSSQVSSTGSLFEGMSMDVYRENAKKSTDPAFQFEFAKYLIATANNLKNTSQHQDAKAIKRGQEVLYNEALKWIKKLCSSGKSAYTEAQFFLAEAYGNGSLGLSTDHEKAFNLYVQASKQSHPASTYRTAVCYEVGAGTKRDSARALQFFRKAAALGDTAGMYKLGMILLNGQLNQNKNPREAVTWLKRAAAQADESTPHALHELGILYEGKVESGGSILPDPAYAYDLFYKAAQFGYAPSQYKLGLCHEYGLLNLNVDPRRSIAWYSKAAEQGDPEAELALSGWYLTGAEGVLVQSDTEAYLWARKAADKGLAKAEYAIGYYVENSIGVNPQSQDFRKWYMRAAAQGNKRAIQRLDELKGYGKSGSVAALGRKKTETFREDKDAKNGDCLLM